MFGEIIQALVGSCTVAEPRFSVVIDALPLHIVMQLSLHFCQENVPDATFTFNRNMTHSMHDGIIIVRITTAATAAAAAGECQPCQPKHLDSEACRPTAYTEHLTCSTSASHKHEVRCTPYNNHAS
jgi:hypothetical protein